MLEPGLHCLGSYTFYYLIELYTLNPCYFKLKLLPWILWSRNFIFSLFSAC